MNDNAANALLKITRRRAARPRASAARRPRARQAAPDHPFPHSAARSEAAGRRDAEESADAPAARREAGGSRPTCGPNGWLARPRPAAGRRRGDSRSPAEAGNLLSARGAPDIAALFSLSDRVSRAADGLSHFGNSSSRRSVAASANGREVGEGDARAIELWEQIAQLYERATGLHLDPRQTVLSSAREVANARRRGAL